MKNLILSTAIFVYIGKFHSQLREYYSGVSYSNYFWNVRACICTMSRNIKVGSETMAQSSGIVHRNEINSQVMYTFCAYSERADEISVSQKEPGWRVLARACPC